MSKYMVVELEITDGEHIVKALEQLGVPRSCIEVHEVPTGLYGYRGDLRQEKANIIVRKENVTKYFGVGAPNDIGFLRMSNGKYRAIVSAYDKTAWWNKKENKFKQYAVESQTIAYFKGKYNIKRVEKDGKIVLVATSKT